MQLNLSQDGWDQNAVRVRGHQDRLAALRGDAQVQFSRQGGLSGAAQACVVQVSEIIRKEMRARPMARGRCLDVWVTHAHLDLPGLDERWLRF